MKSELYIKSPWEETLPAPEKPFSYQNNAPHN
jgi:hypothetical protein